METDKRKNYHENFEEVYLRTPTLRRFLPLADNTILQDESFKKVVRYLADRFYKNTKGYCCATGSAWRTSIACVHVVPGVHRYPADAGGSQRSDYYNIMMNFASQRLCQLCEWIIKKFNTDEAVNEKVHAIEASDAQMDALFFIPATSMSATRRMM